MRRVILLLGAAVLAGCANISPAPLAKGKTKAEALAAYGKPRKIVAISTGETWEYRDVLVKRPTGAVAKVKLLVISFDGSGDVLAL